MYNTIRFIHILAGIAWLGTGFALLQGTRTVLAKDGQVAADRFIERSDWANKWVFIPAPLLALATGITMILTNGGIRFSNLWVIVALVLFVAALVLGGAYGSKLDKEMTASREDGRQDTPEHRQLIDRAVRLSSLDIAIVLGILLMMVFRPVL